MKYSMDNINEFYEELNQAPLIRKLYNWSCYARDIWFTNQKDYVEKFFDRNRQVIVYPISLEDNINDDMNDNITFAVVSSNLSIDPKKEEICYTYYLKNHPNGNAYYDSFDKALIAGMAKKYIGTDSGVDYIFRAMGMER